MIIPQIWASAKLPATLTSSRRVALSNDTNKRGNQQNKEKFVLQQGVHRTRTTRIRHLQRRDDNRPGNRLKKKSEPRIPTLHGLRSIQPRNESRKEIRAAVVMVRGEGQSRPNEQQFKVGSPRKQAHHDQNAGKNARHGRKPKCRWQYELRRVEKVVCKADESPNGPTYRIKCRIGARIRH